MAKLMVVIDPEDQEHRALARCRELSPNADIDIHVCLFIPADNARDMAQNLNEARQWLSEQIAPYEEIGYRVTSEVRSFVRLYEGIIETAISANADILFKPMRQHSLVQRAVLSLTDWNLIRFSPVPLLLVNNADRIHNKPVLAALDVLSHDDKHETLNAVVMSEAARVAAVLESDVSCVNAWNMNPSVMVAGSMDPTPYEIARDKKEDHLKTAREYAQQHGIAPDLVYVEEGTPAFVVNATAAEIEAGVVVIGTVARTGMSGLFVGNTAESVLEGATTDVLVVKSPDFECPL